MNIDDKLTDDDGEIARFKEEAHKEFSDMGIRELAYYFKHGTFDGGANLTTDEIEGKRILISTYLETQSKDYNEKFKEALADPLLGEREEDYFVDKY